MWNLLSIIVSALNAYKKRPTPIVRPVNKFDTTGGGIIALRNVYNLSDSHISNDCDELDRHLWQTAITSRLAITHTHTERLRRIANCFSFRWIPNTVAFKNLKTAYHATHIADRMFFVSEQLTDQASALDTTYHT